MEVGTKPPRLEGLLNRNMNNGRVGGSGKTPHRQHSKSSSPGTHRKEFHSPNRTSQEDGKNTEQQNDEEVVQQTRKILDAFLKQMVDKNGVAERIRRESRQRFEDGDSAMQFEEHRNVGKKMPTRVPLREESNDRKLYRVMTGEMSRHKSDVSVASSGSADSGQKGTFQRTKSFSIAQRNSIVTELENRRGLSRRSSEDIPPTLPLHLENSLPESASTSNNQNTSPVSHARASSDSLIATLDTSGRFKSQNKEKEKKSWFKLFKKKKDGSKCKEENKDSVTALDGLAPKHQSINKVTKNHSDRRTISREESTASRRRSPSPPSSPKRTPKLFRRLSRLAKGGKSDSSSKNSSRSKSLEWEDDEDDLYGAGNGDGKSNSLPIEARLSTKLPPNHEKKHPHQEGKHKEDKHKSHASSVGSTDASHKASKKGHHNSNDMERPKTLDIQGRKKQTSAFKKFKKIIFDSSSSSSSSEEDLRDALQDVLDSDLTEEEKSLRGIKHSNSDNQPAVGDVRDRYQHRSTKSMSDMNPQDKHCTDIAEKLRRVAEHYGHIVNQHHAGPTGRTQTPDSYRQNAHKLSGNGKIHDSGAGARRSASHTGKVPSHSMKAYFNMEAGKARGANDYAGTRRDRITRDEIHHRPSGSFDSPHRPETNHRWSERVDLERIPRSEINRVRQPREFLALDGSPRPARPSPSPQTHHRHPAANVRPPLRHPRRTPSAPPPAMSASPQSSRRIRAVVADSVPHRPHHTYHIERHTDKTVTTKSEGHTKTVHTHTDVVEDVDSDALPDGYDADEPDMAAAFPDDDTEITSREEVTVNEEADNYVTTSAAVRPRTFTAPNLPTPVSDDEEGGAVGGEEAIDEDKLVAKLVEALCSRGDQYNRELETPQIEEAIRSKLSELTKEKAKHVLQRVLSKINETTSTFRHPDIIQLALLFNMAGLVKKLTTQPSVLTGLVDSFIMPIVKRLGGWSMLQSSLDETEEEMNSLEQEGPSTSGENSKKPRSDTEDELD